MRFAALLLHETLPSGPWVFVALIGAGFVFVIPLYFVRRKYGGVFLGIATMLEVIAGIVLMRPTDVLLPAAISGAAAGLILHLRALRRPDGHKIVDIGLAIAGFWFTMLVSAIVAGFAST